MDIITIMVLLLMIVYNRLQAWVQALLVVLNAQVQALSNVLETLSTFQALVSKVIKHKVKALQKCFKVLKITRIV